MGKKYKRKGRLDGGDVVLVFRNTGELDLLRDVFILSLLFDMLAAKPSTSQPRPHHSSTAQTCSFSTLK